jgi:triacylglycerol esterase/lipase EstA (alpha/beta hydrolase family)
MITALILGAILFGGATAYVGWAAWSILQGASGWPFMAGAVALYFAIPLVAASTWFTLAWIFRTPRPPALRIGLRASTRMFWNEMRAIGRAGPRMALYRWLLPDPPPAPASAPVLLLHGVLCNAGVWVGLRRFLAQEGIGPVYTLSYGPPLASIELFAEQTAAKIESILAITGATSLAIVGHSMGGLVARAYLRRHGGDRVGLLMTLGTPHHGSVLAWLFPGLCMGQLRPGNAWLAELNRDEEYSPPARTVSLWSWHDSMVAPQTSARLGATANIELTGVGHNALLGDPAAFVRVADELRRAAANDGVESAAARSAAD